MDFPLFLEESRDFLSGCLLAQGGKIWGTNVGNQLWVPNLAPDQCSGRTLIFGPQAIYSSPDPVLG